MVKAIFRRVESEGSTRLFSTWLIRLGDTPAPSASCLRGNPLDFLNSRIFCPTFTPPERSGRMAADVVTHGVQASHLHRPINRSGRTMVIDGKNMMTMSDNTKGT